jgi:hypothetical protein
LQNKLARVLLEAGAATEGRPYNDFNMGVQKTGQGSNKGKGFLVE